MARRDEELWIVETRHTTDAERSQSYAFRNRAEAVEAASGEVYELAQEELSTFDHADLGDDQVALLEGIVGDNEAGKHDRAVRGWLEYQEDASPDQRIALGPSGSVSESLHDFV